MNFRTDLVCLWVFSNLVPALILPRLLGDNKVERTCLRFDERLDSNVFGLSALLLRGTSGYSHEFIDIS